MAKSKSLKMRNDENNRQIKCLIVEDITTGEIIKHYNHKDFKRIMKSTKSEFLTKVYTPKDKDKESILELIDSRMVETKNGVSAQINDEDVLFKLILQFTDIEIDVTNTEEINDIINNPSELFFAVKIEMEKILMSIFEQYVSLYKTIQSNPQVSELLSGQAQIKKLSQEEQKKQKEIEDLKARLKELGE